MCDAELKCPLCGQEMDAEVVVGGEWSTIRLALAQTRGHLKAQKEVVSALQEHVTSLEFQLALTEKRLESFNRLEATGPADE